MHKPFDNTTIEPKTPGKPHIKFINGWWRVSPWNRKSADKFAKAHAFVNKQNMTFIMGRKKMNIKLNEIEAMLNKIGCVCEVNEAESTNREWWRVFIQVPASSRESDYPLTLGRAMFRNGVLTHVKWYNPPENGSIQAHDIYFYNWLLLTQAGVVLSNDNFEELKNAAAMVATSKYDNKVKLRSLLPKMRNNKPIKRKAIQQPNERSAGSSIVCEMIRRINNDK